MKTMKEWLTAATVSGSLMAAGQPALAISNAPMKATLYTTAWSEYSDNYQYDGAYNSKQGKWNDRPAVRNPAMVAQFNSTVIVPWAFMQVWNSNDPQQAQYNIKSEWDGILHFSDMYGSLPPSSDTAERNAMLDRCKVLGDAACSSVQMNGSSGKNELFTYTDTPSTGQFNSFNAFMNSPKIHAKRTIAIGGANTTDNKSVGYYTYQAIFAHQDRFVANLAKWKQAYPNFGGVDFDFEPPIDASGAQLPVDAQTTSDYANLLSVVIKTRQALGPDADISVTITPNLQYLDAINQSHTDANGQADWFKQMAKVATSINIMTYDFHGPWGHDADPTTAIHSYLAQPNIDNPEKFGASYGAETVINKVLSYGTPANKVQMGVATYGRAYSGVPNTTSYNNLTGFDQVWEHATNFTSDISSQNGLLPYKHVDTLLSQGYQQYHVHKDLNDPASPIVGSYIYNAAVQGGTFIGYESPEAVKAACQFAKAKGLQGMIFWDAASDKPVSDPNSLLGTFKANC